MKKSELRKVIREVIKEQRRAPSGNRRNPSMGLPSLKGLRNRKNLEDIIRNMKSEQEFIQWYNRTLLPYNGKYGKVPSAQELIRSVTGGASSLTEWIKIVRWFKKLVNKIFQVLEGINSACCAAAPDHWCCSDSDHWI